MTARNLNLVSEDKKTAALERAHALVPVLAARAAATERNRRVPDETISDFHRTGLFRSRRVSVGPSLASTALRWSRASSRAAVPRAPGSIA
jgi:hypothetical protein